jgi:DNA-directed RNA polymerase III subunit RPC1
MTLKTFHFAGVASMNITQGVPRIKEIINAVKNISTPLITAALIDSTDESSARRVKARIERTTLGDIAEYIEEVYLPDDMFLLLKVSAKRVQLLQLELNMHTIVDAICAAKLMVPVRAQHVRLLGHSMLTIRPEPSGKTPLSLYQAMQYLKHNLGTVVVKGIPSVNQ